MRIRHCKRPKSLALVVLALLTCARTSWGQPILYQKEGLTAALPANWAAQSVENIEDQPLAVLRSSRGSIVIIRAYTSDGSSLDELLRQLSYGIVVKQEGRLLKTQNCTLLGKPARKVEYWARSTNGPMKNFVRYYFVIDGEVLTIHCVSNSNFSADLQDFQELVTHLNYKQPPQEPSQPSPDKPKEP